MEMFIIFLLINFIFDIFPSEYKNSHSRNSSLHSEDKLFSESPDANFKQFRQKITPEKLFGNLTCDDEIDFSSSGYTILESPRNNTIRRTISLDAKQQIVISKLSYDVVFDLVNRVNIKFNKKYTADDIIRLCADSDHYEFQDIIKEWINKNEIYVEISGLCLCNVINSKNLVNWKISEATDVRFVNNEKQLYDLLKKVVSEFKVYDSDPQLNKMLECQKFFILKKYCEQNNHSAFGMVYRDWSDKYGYELDKDFCICKIRIFNDESFEYFNPYLEKEVYSKNNKKSCCSSCVIL